MTSLSQKEDLGIGTDATRACKGVQEVDMDASARSNQLRASFAMPRVKNCQELLALNKI